MPLSERTKTEVDISASTFTTTTVDMEDLFKWKHGQTLRGTHALEHLGMKNYRNDINAAWGRERDYDSNMIFVDTFKKVGDQLEELK